MAEIGKLFISPAGQYILLRDKDKMARFAFLLAPTRLPIHLGVTLERQKMIIAFDPFR